MAEKKYGNPISVSTCFSSSYDCDDMDGWESDCSGPIIEAHSLKASYKGPDSLMENPNEPAKTFPSPSKATFFNTSAGKDSRNSLSCRAGTAFSNNNGNRLACIRTKSPKGKISHLGNANVGSQDNYPFEAVCSTLLTAVQEFQNIVSNFLLMSRSNHKHSREKCFKESSQSLHSEHKFFSNQGRTKEQGNLKSRKSLDFQQPACIFEKLFARSKGSDQESFIEVASRQSFNYGDREIQSSANENGLLLHAPITVSSRSPRNAMSALYDTDHISLSSTEALDESVSSHGVESPGVESPGARSPSTRLLSTLQKGVQCLPVDDNKPASHGRDLLPGDKRSTTRWHSTTLHKSSAGGNTEDKPDHIVTLLKQGQRNSPVQDPCAETPRRVRDPRNKMPYEHDVTSSGTRTARVTQCSTPPQGCLPPEASNEPKLLPKNGSPLLTPSRDKGVTPPGVESSRTGRRSVPLRATPGSNNLRFSDISIGLLHQTSTPEKQTLDEKRDGNILSPDPETFFKQKKIQQPRRSLLASVVFPPADSTPSPIRPSSKRDQSAEPDKSSACHSETRTRRGPSRVRDNHEGSSRRRLYTRGAGERSPPTGETLKVTQRTFPGVEPEMRAPFQDETVDGRKASPSTTPKGSRLGVRLCASPMSSNEDSPRGKSLKMKNTPRRKSTGCHPYRPCCTADRKSPSLASPLQALRILSPSGGDASGRWSTIRHSTGKHPAKYEKELFEEPARFTRDLKSRAMKAKDNFEHAEENATVVSDCSKGNCRKTFCFNCSMDCS